MTEKVVWHVVKTYAKKLDISKAHSIKQAITHVDFPSALE